ncbi:MAG TPA: beta-N-acetylhexosaminidase [Desulfuromonadaceae bacterium]|nr:beta-N-acetylhexosaminidase [Desulfuromonadaceae bacterium]
MMTPSCSQLFRRRAFVTLVAAVITLLSPVVFAAETNTLAIIPQPQKVDVLPGQFQLTDETEIVSSCCEGEAHFLAETLQKATGFKLPISAIPAHADAPKIQFLIQTNLPPEGYELTVTQKTVEIQGSTPAGIFYGVQTLLQLLPPQIFSERRLPARSENTPAVPETGAPGSWTIPCVHIEDHPRFAWRGLMLDVSRHFYNKQEVEKILDEMALHKLNTLHWHLTDDQGWRIEIKKYPKLTDVGAWRTASKLRGPKGEVDESGNDHPAWATVADSKFNADKRYGGFYTQDDIREVVAYAALRHITIVPEIEMPGHAVAALAAYPQLNSDTNIYTTDVKAGVNSGVFNPSDPETFKFLEDVLTEVFALFPGKYIHVGGDEVNKGVKAKTWGQSTNCQALMQREDLKNTDELQSWFTKQIQKFVSAHGKTLIGWTEIAEGGMPADAAIMDWKGGGLEAAKAGHDVVMSPTKFCYLDYYQSTNHLTEPHAIGGYLSLEKVYQFDPVPAKLAPEFHSHILGGQCNLWTEYVASLPHVEYMMWPRACALAEATWSPKESRDYADFLRRLQVHAKRLDEMGVNYRRASISNAAP